MKGKLLMIALMAVFIIGLVEAATVTLTQPSSSSELRGTGTVLNVSLTTELNNMTLAWFYGRDLATANSSFVHLAKVDGSNVANNSQFLVFTGFDSNTLTDGSSYEFYAIAGNSTNNYTSATTTGITVDNTAPSCIDNSAVSNKGTVLPTKTWSYTGGNATLGTIKFDGNNYNLAKGSFTGKQLALTFSTKVPEKIYNSVEATVSDGRNSTSCGVLNFINVDSGEHQKGVGAVAYELQQQQQQKKNSNLVLIIAIIAAAIIIGDKKKKK